MAKGGFKVSNFMYTDEELEEIDKKLKNASKEEDKRILEFWKTQYPFLSYDEKAEHWAGELFRGMRSQEESGLNPYAIYSENWLKDALEKEPNFIQMLPKIYNTWGGMFDSTKVDRIIQRLLKQINK